MNKKTLAFIFVCLNFSVANILFAQTQPERALSEEERARQLQEKEKALREKIEEKKEIPSIKEEELPKREAAESIQKTLIQSINVIGATLIPQQEIREITKPFLNQELALKDMQKAADLITDAYRQKGYVTYQLRNPAS